MQIAHAQVWSSITANLAGARSCRRRLPFSSESSARRQAPCASLPCPSHVDGHHGLAGAGDLLWSRVSATRVGNVPRCEIVKDRGTADSLNSLPRPNSRARWRASFRAGRFQLKTESSLAQFSVLGWEISVVDCEFWETWVSLDFPDLVPSHPGRSQQLSSRAEERKWACVMCRPGRGAGSTCAWLR